MPYLKIKDGYTERGIDFYKKLAAVTAVNGIIINGTSYSPNPNLSFDECVSYLRVMDEGIVLREGHTINGF